MENLFQNLENNLVHFGYSKKHFGGMGIHPNILVNNQTNTSIGIKNDGSFFVSTDSPIHYEFKTIGEVINFIKK